MTETWKKITTGEGLYGLAGIYGIRHIPSGRTLICSTTNLGKRIWDEHYRLRKGQHYNVALRSDLQHDGPEAFEILLVTTSRRQDLLMGLKQHHVMQLRKNGMAYNQRTGTWPRQYGPERRSGARLTPTSIQSHTNGQDRMTVVLDHLPAVPLTLEGRHQRATNMIGEFNALLRSLTT